MRKSLSIWAKFERYPPVLVRLLAKRGPSKLYSDHEIHLRAQGALTLADIKRLSYSPTWDDVPVAKMKAFCLACGVDFSNRRIMQNLNRYISNKPAFTYLQRDPRFPEFQAMLVEYYNHERRLHEN